MSRRGIHRYLQPKLFPIYGILIAFLVMRVIGWTTGVLLYEEEFFYLGSHMVTIADGMIVSGGLLGVLYWRLRK